MDIHAHKYRWFALAGLLVLVLFVWLRTVAVNQYGERRSEYQDRFVKLQIILPIIIALLLAGLLWLLNAEFGGPH